MAGCGLDQPGRPQRADHGQTRSNPTCLESPKWTCSLSLSCLYVHSVHHALASTHHLKESTPALGWLARDGGGCASGSRQRRSKRCTAFFPRRAKPFSRDREQSRARLRAAVRLVRQPLPPGDPDNCLADFAAKRVSARRVVSRSPLRRVSIWPGPEVIVKILLRGNATKLRKDSREDGQCVGS